MVDRVISFHSISDHFLLLAPRNEVDFLHNLNLATGNYYIILYSNDL